MSYHSSSKEIEQRIRQDQRLSQRCPFRASESDALRRNPSHDKATLLRPAFVRDAEKILHSPFYNRLSDKTQVFSLYKNDDLARRSLHVQLVSRTARSIGATLGLNTDLIEAIALGHDIGHTPFGHLGERFLSELFHKNTGLFFDHNVHSVRVLDGIFRHNLTLATLSGILCHNGEFEQQEYRPQPLATFDEFDEMVAQCRSHTRPINTLIPSTLEGCLVRICDMIAYVGKDRQDAERTVEGVKGTEGKTPAYSTTTLGTHNAEIINNLSVDLVENSYGNDYLKFSDEAFCFLRTLKKENYANIYNNDEVNDLEAGRIGTMFERLYERLLTDLTTGLATGDESSYIFQHHLRHIKELLPRYKDTVVNPDEDPNQIVVDYIASMSDDYFVELHARLFPDEEVLEYRGYF